MDLESARKRLGELAEQEKQAWAQLNFICGARAELERWMAETIKADEPVEPAPLQDA
jgi:hypothetical protein